MLVYCYLRPCRTQCCLCVEPPERAKEDDPWRGLKAGESLAPINTILFTIPEGLSPSLPPFGEVRRLNFHVDLWGVAQELPSYDKKLWVDLQRALGA